MCHCKKKSCSKECFFKLKFINYINDNMIKNTNAGALYIDELTCDTLGVLKSKLEEIVNKLQKENDYIIKITPKKP